MEPNRSTEQTLAVLRQLPPEVSFQKVTEWVEKHRLMPVVRRDRHRIDWLSFIRWWQRN